MLEILEKLVSYPTVSEDTKANGEALKYISQFLSDRGMHIAHYQWDGFESLVATTKPNHKTPAVMLAAHLDVVPAVDESQYKLTQRDDKIFGRGVLDMKVAIAAYLQVIDDIKDNLTQYDIGVMITTDEELSAATQANGTQRLVAEGYKPQVCILPDGGRDWNIEVLAKGCWHVQLSTTGKSAHGSRPWEGDNAIDKLMAAIAEVRAIFPDQGPATNTYNVGVIEGGMATNQIPAAASASIDVRYISEEDRDRIHDAMEKIAQKYGAKLELLKHLPLNKNSLDNPWISTFKDCIENVIGHEISGVISNGANDTVFFGQIGVPSVVFYPIGGGHHGAEEWIDAKVPDQFTQIIRDYLDQKAC